MAESPEQVVIITGGTSGIGLAAAERFVQSGARVFIGARTKDRLAQVKLDFEKRGRRIETIQIDVSRVSDCERFVAETVNRAGRIDVAINSAGVWVEGPAEEMTEAQWDQVLDINLKGTFFICRSAIPELVKTQGCIINVGSDAGLTGNVGATIYSASKGGVSLLTRALAVELAPRGVRVNAVCPADVDTPMLENQARDYGGDDPDGYFQNLLTNYPQGQQARFIHSDEVAEAIFYLSSPKAAPITGICLPVDFGVTAGY